jgi:hypothetical protein
MDVTERDVKNLERIAEEVFGDTDYLEIEEVKDTKGDVMVSVRAVEDADSSLSTRNAFAARRLDKFHDNGYVAVAVGGGDTSHSAWFERPEDIEFGSPDPSGDYELSDGWSIVVGNSYGVLHHRGSTVAHVARDGWELDEYVLHRVLPSKVTEDLTDIGFEKGDVSADD